MIIDWITGAGLSQETYYTGLDYISLYGGGAPASSNSETVEQEVCDSSSSGVPFPVSNIGLAPRMVMVL